MPPISSTPLAMDPENHLHPEAPQQNMGMYGHATPMLGVSPLLLTHSLTSSTKLTEAYTPLPKTAGG